MSFDASGQYVPETEPVVRGRRTVQRECPCGDTMTVTSDDGEGVISVLFEPFDELHAECADPCPRCEGTGQIGPSSQGRYAPRTCDECSGSGREAED